MVSYIKYPLARHDLILYLKDLSDFEMQKKEWCNPKFKHPFWDNMRFSIEALLDEWALDDDSVGNIGWILRDKKEAVLVEKPSKLLKKIIEEVGVGKTDSMYFTSPLWQEVVQAAKEAYDYIMIYEDMDNLLSQCREDSEGEE